MEYKIIGEVNEIISSYDLQSIEILQGLNFHQSQLLKMIEFYSNSKYLLGQLDELGKEKPFQNIGNAICDVENAAVDIDTKDLVVTADLPQDYPKSFMLQIELKEWMKESDFAVTLNDMRDTRTRYGGVVVKKCIEKHEGEKEKTLEIEVCEWKNLVTDPLDIENGVIIEKHYMSPAELSKKRGAWDNVEEAIKLATKTRKQKNSTNQNATNKKVPIYEVRGEFSQFYFKQAQGEMTTDEDNFDYSYQFYIIAGEEGGDQVLLYSEDNADKVYKYLARKKKSGRALGMGVIEENEQSQIWINDAVQKQQRAIEYTSKVIGQSASRSLKGRNILTEVENGQILEHDDGRPITSLQLAPSGGMGEFQNLINQWYQNAEKTSSSYAAQRGEAPPSGTPYRLQASILNQSSSVFDDIREEFGIFVGELFDDWILPFLGSRLNKAHILSHEFSADELKALDTAYSTHQANQQAIEAILSGKLVSQEEYDTFTKGALDLVRTSKSHRFFDIPKDYYKDLQTKVGIDPTGEQRNKSAALESLQNVLQSASANPALLQDPVMSQIFMKIVELSGAGISPISLISGIQEQGKLQAEQQAMMAEQQPQMPQPKQMSLTANPNG